jgi:hypothetical protein
VAKHSEEDLKMSAILTGLRSIRTELEIPEEFAENADTDSDNSDDDSVQSEIYRAGRKRKHSDCRGIENKSQIEKLETRIHYLRLELVNKEVSAEEDKKKYYDLLKKLEPFNQINQLMNEYTTLIVPRDNTALTSVQLQTRIDSLKNKLEANSSRINSQIDLVEYHFLKYGLVQMMEHKSLCDSRNMEKTMYMKKCIQFRETAMIASVYSSFILGLLLVTIVLYLIYSPSF